MSRYSNGKLPASELVQVGTPTQVTTRATAQRWGNFVEDARRTYGWVPRITPGENAYRDYDTQVRTKAWACNQGNCGLAAAPGFSSHGGEFEGRDAMAFDVAHWQEVGWAKFKTLAERNGFTVGWFSSEPWHIIDFAPFTMPAGGGNAINTGMPAAPTRKGQQMDLLLLLITPNSGGLRRYLIDPRKEAHREISSLKYNIYNNAGFLGVAGVQPEAYLDQFPNTF